MCLVAYLTKRPHLSEIFFWPKFLLVYSLRYGCISTGNSETHARRGGAETQEEEQRAGGP